MGAEIPDGAVLLARVVINSSLWTMRLEDRTVAITCICLANWRDRQWFDGQKKITIKRGQFVRSRERVAEACGMKIQSVRTSLKHLENVGFLTRKATKRYTVYSLPKYDFYQSLGNYSNPKSNQQLTHDQPTPNPRLTTNKNGEELYEGKEEEESAAPSNLNQDQGPDIITHAQALKTILGCTQSPRVVAEHLTAACGRGSVVPAAVVAKAQADISSHAWKLGEPVWAFLESRWPVTRAEPRARDLKLGRLPGEPDKSLPPYMNPEYCERQRAARLAKETEIMAERKKRADAQGANPCTSTAPAASE